MKYLIGQFTNTCPLCDKELTIKTDHLDGPFSILLESHSVCSHCNQYNESFVTGNYQYNIAGKEFEYFYSQSEEIKSKIQVALNMVIKQKRFRV